MNPANEPRISVVVILCGQSATLDDCLHALFRQEVDVSIEVIVVGGIRRSEGEALARRFPQARLLDVSEPSSLASLWAKGLESARGQVVAFLASHCLVRDGWLQAIEQARQAGRLPCGGSIDNGNPRGWAPYLCEYARFMSPLTHGETSALPWKNSAYDRSQLRQVGADLQTGLFDGFLQQRLREQGIVCHSDPAMAVEINKRTGFFAFLRERFHYSRWFAGRRLQPAAWWKRLGYAAAALLLPAVLLVRLTSVIIRKGGHGKQFVRSLPALCVCFLVWAVGEGVGAILGPGNSLQRLE